MTVFQQKKKEEKKNVKMSAAEARSRAVWASRTQSRALTIELLGLLLKFAKIRIDIDSYYIFKLQLLFILSRDCHLLSYSNCCFHYCNTVTILDTLPTTTELCQKFEIKAKISKAKGHHNKSYNTRYVWWSTWSEETLY